MTREITIAYTPDSDDAFYYYALQNNIVRVPDVKFNFEVDHIINLNNKSLKCEYDVLAISSVFYPQVSSDYQILSVGTSVGRGYGPVLVSKNFKTIQELRRKQIGIAGLPTTGGFLAQFTLPDSQLVEMQFDLIADAIVRNELDAGVMIHEELLYYPQKGLHKVADLGAVWEQKTNLPLPVGLNIIGRHLDESLKKIINDAIRDSLGYALTHKEEALAWATSFGRGVQADCGEEHIEMFANIDSVMMPTDVREALGYLYNLMTQQGLAMTIPPLDIVDGNPDALNRILQLINTKAKAA